MIAIPHTSAFCCKSKSPTYLQISFFQYNADFIHLQQSVETRRQAQILRRKINETGRSRRRRKPL
jgi:hypothetical protein